MLTDKQTHLQTEMGLLIANVHSTESTCSLSTMPAYVECSYWHQSLTSGSFTHFLAIKFSFMVSLQTKLLFQASREQFFSSWLNTVGHNIVTPPFCFSILFMCRLWLTGLIPSNNSLWVRFVAISGDFVRFDISCKTSKKCLHQEGFSVKQVTIKHHYFVLLCYVVLISHCSYFGSK